MLCLYLKFDQIIIILQRTVYHRKRVMMKKFSVVDIGCIYLVIGIFAHALSLLVFILEIYTIKTKTFDEENINTNINKLLNIGIAGCVFNGIGLICCILPFCGFVMPLLIFTPVDFINGIVFIIMVGYVLPLCSITTSSDQNNQLIFFSCTA